MPCPASGARVHKTETRLCGTLDSMAVRVVVGEDSFLVRQGIAQVIETLPDVELAASCDTPARLRTAIEQHRPDVVVTDIRMPPGQSDEGIVLADELRRTHPEMGVVVLSQYQDPEYVMALLASGSAGRAYMLKDHLATPAQLAYAIGAVADGGSWVDPQIVEVLVAERSRIDHSPLRTLTPREHEVLMLVAQGHSNGAIAEELVLTK